MNDHEKNEKGLAMFSASTTRERPSLSQKRTAFQSETAARHLRWRQGDTAGPAMISENTELVMESRGDTLLVHGDVDLHQAAAFRRGAEAHIHRAAQPRLDLSGVPFLDSAGLAALIALARLAQGEGKSLRLVVTGSPRRVLKITGIDRMLLLED